MDPRGARAVHSRWSTCRHRNLLEDVDVAERGVVLFLKGAPITTSRDVKPGVGTGLLTKVAPECDGEVIATNWRTRRWKSVGF